MNLKKFVENRILSDEKSEKRNDVGEREREEGAGESNISLMSKIISFTYNVVCKEYRIFT